MIKLSVVIPVYSVEEYIERCARSLFEQTLDDIEYIFVDDCSPDNSIKKLELTLEEYPHRKPQTRIMRMPTNSGLPAVRRHGVIAAKGEYIVHCDSDDWVETNAYQEAYEFAKKGDYDIVFFNFVRSDGDKMNIRINRHVSYDDKERLLSELLSGKLMGSVCGGICKRELYEGITWPKYNMIEDLTTMVQLVYKANHIGHLEKAFYYYYFNPNSITGKQDVDSCITNFNHHKNNLETIIHFLESKGLAITYKEELTVCKVSVKMNLKMHTLKPKIRKMWIDTYPDVNCKAVLNSKYISRKKKFLFIGSWLGAYPIFKRIKNRLKK